jgi:RNA polymerase sigma-70 factor (ECF subfamily)
MRRRSNAEWMAALRSEGDDQAVALADLRIYLMRAARFTLQRARHHVGHLGTGALDALAEDCAQEALTAVVQHLHEFRGQSLFTTWVYAFGVNMALMAARRERWGTVSLDAMVDNREPLLARTLTEDDVPDPERRAMQAAAIAAIHDAIDGHLTPRQQQAVRALVFEDVPLDELVRYWGSNRNAVYKLLHDARRKLKTHLAARGYDVGTMLDLFAAPSKIPGGRATE